MIEISEDFEHKLEGITFIDLFSGIGGFRLALSSFGAKCVFSVDNDKNASKTYDLNFNDNSFGDITKIDSSEIPSHDILCSGFPCQAFSISGKQLGFEDTRGTLFFDVLRIAEYHKPKILFLENVSNLKRHDNGRTYRIIKKSLHDLGYNVYSEILNSSNYGIPQSRKRIYFVCIRKDIDNKNFKFPQPFHKKITVKNILIEDEKCKDLILKKKYELNEEKIKKYSKQMNKPLRIGTVNKGGQGDRIYSINGHSITLSATGGGNGAKTGLYYINNQVRKLHPRETARLMGFPEEYEINKSTFQAHKQFGNSVVVNVLQYIVEEIIKDGSVFNDEKKGSQIAKNGFKNEKDVAHKFNNWKLDKDAQKWLKIMEYDLNDIEYVIAKILYGYKTDVQITIKLKSLIDAQNIQVKLISNPQGFNQIDKRWVSRYSEMWNMPKDVKKLLKYFTGELEPYKKDVKDSRRMFITEFTKEEQNKLLDFFKTNKILILNDIIKGREGFSAEWMLVAQKSEIQRWVLKPINVVLNHYGNGEVQITPRGSLRIGNATMQRKGGDNGCKTANMLQFKVNPAELFDL